MLDLEGSALQKIDRIFPVLRQVDRELGIDWIFVLILNAPEHPSHLFHELLVINEALTGYEPHLPVPAGLAKPSLGIVIML